MWEELLVKQKQELKRASKTLSTKEPYPASLQNRQDASIAIEAMILLSTRELPWDRSSLQTKNAVVVAIALIIDRYKTDPLAKFTQIALTRILQQQFQFDSKTILNCFYKIFPADPEKRLSDILDYGIESVPLVTMNQEIVCVSLRRSFFEKLPPELLQDISALAKNQTDNTTKQNSQKRKSSQLAEDETEDDFSEKSSEEGEKKDKAPQKPSAKKFPPTVPTNFFISSPPISEPSQTSSMLTNK
jgi:hypothetical protein